MQKDVWAINIFTCAAAAFAAFLRWFQKQSVFESDTGLPTSGALISMVLCLFFLVVLVALFFLTQRLRPSLAGRESENLLRGRTILYFAVSLLLGTLLAVSGILTFLGADSFPYPSLRQIAAIGMLASGVALPCMVLCARREENPLSCIAFLIPVIFLCFFLIIFYKENSNDPVVWNFAPQIIAIASSLLGFFYLAGFVFHKPRPMRSIYFSNLAVIASAATLADTMPISQVLLFVALALCFLLFSCVMTLQLSNPKR